MPRALIQVPCAQEIERASFELIEDALCSPNLWNHHDHELPVRLEELAATRGNILDHDGRSMKQIFTANYCPSASSTPSPSFNAAFVENLSGHLRKLFGQTAQ